MSFSRKPDLSASQTLTTNISEKPGLFRSQSAPNSIAPIKSKAIDIHKRPTPTSFPPGTVPDSIIPAEYYLQKHKPIAPISEGHEEESKKGATRNSNSSSFSLTQNEAGTPISPLSDEKDLDDQCLFELSISGKNQRPK